jgi:hypothetical protein
MDILQNNVVFKMCSKYWSSDAGLRWEIVMAAAAYAKSCINPAMAVPNHASAYYEWNKMS